jgi:hypothetical protein
MHIKREPGADADADSDSSIQWMGTAPLPAKDFDPTARRTFKREPTGDDATVPSSFKRPRQLVPGQVPTVSRQSNVDHIRSASRYVVTPYVEPTV